MMAFDDLLRIRIRDDLEVQMLPLPHDLTRAEAEKIAAVIMAHVKETSNDPTG